MGLFSDLSSLGFDETENVEVFAQQKKEDRLKDNDRKNDVKNEEDYLFQKNIECPCCGIKFQTLLVRAGKIRPVGQDEDLRPRFEGIDPLKYDAVVCPICGYAALNKNFETTLPVQRKKIREEITPQFMGLDQEGPTYSYDEAILRYKMALLCDIVGYGKNSRKAYTSLKLSWVIRGKLETEGEELDEEQRKSLEDDQQECIENAYNGFKTAYSSENFPMCGMDEVTVSYLLAVLACKLEQYEDAAKYVYPILGNKNVSSRIKNKVLDLKDKISERMQQK